MTITDDRLAIAQVAEATGLSTHTLRYYERAGLMLDPVDRASSTHRRYSAGDVGWVQFLTKLRSTGMPIAQVRQYVDLARLGDSTVDARRELLQGHRVEVLRQLDDTKKSLAAIDIKIALYKEKTDNK